MRIEWPPITEHVWWLTEHRPSWRDAAWVRMRDMERETIAHVRVERLCPCARDSAYLLRRYLPVSELPEPAPVIELHYVLLPEHLRSVQIEAYLLGRCGACGVVWWRSYAGQEVTPRHLTARKPPA